MVYGLDGWNRAHPELISLRPARLCQQRCALECCLLILGEACWLLKLAYKMTLQVQNGAFRLCLEMCPGWMHLYTCSLVSRPLKHLLEWNCHREGRPVTTHTPPARHYWEVAESILELIFCPFNYSFTAVPRSQLSA